MIRPVTLHPESPLERILVAQLETLTNEQLQKLVVWAAQELERRGHAEVKPLG